MTKTIKELEKEFTEWADKILPLLKQYKKMEEEAKESSCRRQQNDIWKPKEGDEVFYVDVKNSVVCLSGMSWDIPWQVTMYEKGLFYPTRELAQHEVNRRKAMNKRWLPKYKETFWCWFFTSGEVYETLWLGGDEGDLRNYIIGNCHATEEEAKAWGARYAESFKVLWEGK